MKIKKNTIELLFMGHVLAPGIILYKQEMVYMSEVKNNNYNYNQYIWI